MKAATVDLARYALRMSTARPCEGLRHTDTKLSYYRSRCQDLTQCKCQYGTPGYGNVYQGVGYAETMTEQRTTSVFFASLPVLAEEKRKEQCCF